VATNADCGDVFSGGFAAVADGAGLDCVLVFEIEEHAVVATAETEAVRGGLTFFTPP
jgi:hypothetical protein